jgi:hypothetical protein
LRFRNSVLPLNRFHFHCGVASFAMQQARCGFSAAGAGSGQGEQPVMPQFAV